MAKPSFVKSCKDYFEGGGERKITFEEFKALTPEDKAELRDLLIGEGYDVLPLAGS